MLAKHKFVGPAFMIDVDLGILLDGSEEAIDSLLALFERYNIPATWAILGCLFIENPSRMKDIIRRIKANPIHHEIAYHSFLHINFAERSQYYIKNELKEGTKLANEHGLYFKSFVFPNNSIGQVNLLKEYGFNIYRGKNISRARANQNKILYIMNKVLDEVTSEPVEPIWANGIWDLPCSMPFSNTVIFPSVITTLKARLGVNKAIYSRKIFHTYIHPQDLIYHPILKRRLNDLLSFVDTSREKHNIKTLTMGELASILNSV